MDVKVIKFPTDLLKKFADEKSFSIVQGPINGMMLLSEAVLSKIGLGDVSKQGLDVLIVKKVGGR